MFSAMQRIQEEDSPGSGEDDPSTVPNDDPHKAQKDGHHEVRKGDLRKIDPQKKLRYDREHDRNTRFYNSFYNSQRAGKIVNGTHSDSDSIHYDVQTTMDNEHPGRLLNQHDRIRRGDICSVVLASSEWADEQRRIPRVDRKRQNPCMIQSVQEVQNEQVYAGDNAHSLDTTRFEATILWYYHVKELEAIVGLNHPILHEIVSQGYQYVLSDHAQEMDIEYLNLWTRLAVPIATDFLFKSMEPGELVQLEVDSGDEEGCVTQEMLSQAFTWGRRDVATSNQWTDTFTCIVSGWLSNIMHLGRVGHHASSTKRLPLLPHQSDPCGLLPHALISSNLSHLADHECTTSTCGACGEHRVLSMRLCWQTDSPASSSGSSQHVQRDIGSECGRKIAKLLVMRNLMLRIRTLATSTTVENSTFRRKVRRLITRLNTLAE
jgi:hypothetical protein